jgi:hypothetical protein
MLFSKRDLSRFDESIWQRALSSPHDCKRRALDPYRHGNIHESEDLLGIFSDFHRQLFSLGYFFEKSG